LLYGSETWVVTAREIRRLEVFHLKCLRTILGITMRDHKRNEDILAETSQLIMAEIMTSTRLRWLGHVARMNDDRLPIRVLYGALDKGKAARGKAKGRWKDMILMDLKSRNVMSWYEIAKNRRAWTRVVKGEAVEAGKVRRILKRKVEENETKEKKEVKAEHETTSSGKTFQCPRCDKILKSKTWLTRHWQKEHSSEILAGSINHDG